jgi:hypothetical protein
MQVQGKRQSREILSNIVHYVKTELNIGGAAQNREREPPQFHGDGDEDEEEPTTDYGLTEAGETYTATGTSIKYIKLFIFFFFLLIV